MKLTSLCLAALVLTMAGCHKKNPAEQVRQNGLPKASQAAPAQGGIAIVDIDTLEKKYELCTTSQKQLEAKQNAYRQQLNAKAQALQNAMIAFQKKAQSGAFTSQQQAESEQASLQRQQQALQAFQEKVEMDMAKATQNYQQTLRDSLHHFIKDFNADGRFKVILSKVGDNVLYADPATDITNEVVTGLNQRYKK